MAKHVHRHLYIHTPFCNGKCTYCSFYSTLFTDSLANRWLHALDTEFQLQSRSFNLRPETIYIGGGTPTILPLDQLTRLVELIRQYTNRGDLKEWTIEANPGTLTPEKLKILRRAGVNRISMGAQSFRNLVLHNMQRRHTARAVADTIAQIRSAGIANIGLDLISALPGVGPSTWRTDLAHAVALQPSHISVYSLTVEPESRLGQLAKKGLFQAPSDSRQLSFLTVAARTLTKAGYVRYEISNYARPGHECIHNLSCWQGEDYLGLGPSASSRSQQQRWTNSPDLHAYCHALNAGKLPPGTSETLSPKTDLFERMVFTLRTSTGLHLASFAKQYPQLTPHLPKVKQSLTDLTARGFLQKTGPGWHPTSKGMNIADALCEALWPD